MAAGNANRCTNCNRLGHTAGKCVSKDRLPSAAVRAEKSFMSVISCYNCGRLGHVAKECRQRPNNSLRGRRSHADFGRHETSLLVKQ